MTAIREVSLQEMRAAIGQGAAGAYCAYYAPDHSAEVWTRQALELEAFASGKGYVARSHPWIDKGRHCVDVLAVSIPTV